MHGRAGQNRVRDIGVYTLGAIVFQCISGLAQGAGGIDDVVNQDADLVLHVTDDVHDLGNIGLGATLVDDGQIDIVEALGHGAGTYDAADIRADHDEVVLEATQNVIDQNGRGVNVIDRNIEE